MNMNRGCKTLIPCLARNCRSLAIIRRCQGNATGKDTFRIVAVNSAIGGFAGERIGVRNKLDLLKENVLSAFPEDEPTYFP
jgi:hypothetical protein